MSQLPVVLHPRVQRFLDEAYAWWAKHRSAEQAGRWLAGIESMILGLGDFPERHPFARENDRLPLPIRQATFGLGRQPTHRVLFTIRPDCVYVLAVRHMAQDDVEFADL